MITQTKQIHHFCGCVEKTASLYLCYNFLLQFPAYLNKPCTQFSLSPSLPPSPLSLPPFLSLQVQWMAFSQPGVTKGFPGKKQKISFASQEDILRSQSNQSCSWATVERTPGIFAGEREKKLCMSERWRRRGYRVSNKGKRKKRNWAERVESDRVTK